MTNYAIQEQNQDLVSLLAAHFRLLYNPAHAFADAVAMLQMFPGIAGIWSTAVTDASGRLIDISGNGLHMTANNTPQFGAFGASLAPFVRYVAINSQYHSLASAIGSTTDINGNESYIRSDQNGFSFACVVNFSSIPLSAFHIASKSASGANSWILAKDAVNNISFSVYNGGAATTVTSSITVVANQNYIISARFDPSTALYLRVNDDEQSNTTAIPATIDSTATPFTVGARSTPSNYLDGVFSLGILTASYVPDYIESAWYQMTAPLFGISI